jgi:hypothetical protein
MVHALQNSRGAERFGELFNYDHRRWKLEIRNSKPEANSNDESSK